jgi:hypothetical protein
MQLSAFLKFHSTVNSFYSYLEIYKLRLPHLITDVPSATQVTWSSLRNTPNREPDHPSFLGCKFADYRSSTSKDRTGYDPPFHQPLQQLLTEYVPLPRNITVREHLHWFSSHSYVSMYLFICLHMPIPPEMWNLFHTSYSWFYFYSVVFSLYVYRFVYHPANESMLFSLQRWTSSDQCNILFGNGSLLHVWQINYMSVNQIWHFMVSAFL